MVEKQLTRRDFFKGAGLIGILGMVGGCGSDNQYHFNGEINGEKIRFYEKNLGNNYLEIIKKDGTKLEYGDIETFGWGKYLINHIKIIKKDGREKSYKNDEIGKPILEEGQKQFNYYLEKILKYKEQEKKRILNEKQKEGLDLIKK